MSAEAALWAATGAVFERDLPVAGELLGRAEHHAELVDDALTAAHVVVTRGMVALLSAATMNDVVELVHAIRSRGGG